MQEKKTACVRLLYNSLANMSFKCFARYPEPCAEKPNDPQPIVELRRVFSHPWLLAHGGNIWKYVFQLQKHASSIKTCFVDGFIFFLSVGGMFWSLPPPNNGKWKWIRTRESWWWHASWVGAHSKFHDFNFLDGVLIIYESPITI